MLQDLTKIFPARFVSRNIMRAHLVLMAIIAHWAFMSGALVLFPIWVMSADIQKPLVGAHCTECSNLSEHSVSAQWSLMSNFVINTEQALPKVLKNNRISWLYIVTTIFLKLFKRAPLVLFNLLYNTYVPCNIFSRISYNISYKNIWLKISVKIWVKICQKKICEHVDIFSKICDIFYRKLFYLFLWHEFIFEVQCLSLAPYTHTLYTSRLLYYLFMLLVTNNSKPL